MQAYVTLLSTESYLQGVLALSNSLKTCRSSYPLYCLLSEAIGEDVTNVLSRHGIPYIQLDKTVVAEGIAGDKHFSHWNFTFDKLCVWGLTQFKKVVFLDSDMIVLRNLDHLFQRDSFTAVCAGHSLPGCEHWVELNSGLMVIEPNKDTEREMVSLAVSCINEHKDRNQSIGDQDIINKYFPGWKDKPSLHLDEGYNVFANALTYYVKHLGYSLDNRGKAIYVVHFIGRTKPWMLTKSLKNMVWLLWQVLRNPAYFKIYIRYMGALNRKA